MASTFSSTEPFSSTDHNYKNYRKFWCKKVKVLSLLNPIVQKLLFLPSLFPLLLRRPRVPPYWGQGLLFGNVSKLPSLVAPLSYLLTSYRRRGRRVSSQQMVSWPTPAKQGHLLTGMRRLQCWASTPLQDVVDWIGDHLGWEDCNDEHPPPSKMFFFTFFINYKTCWIAKTNKILVLCYNVLISACACAFSFIDRCFGSLLAFIPPGG